MLIGSTNNPGGGDPGRLKVTLRHNVFDGIGQRAPRMRFGQIDVYNNHYKVAVNALSYEFAYLWGVGVESSGFFENNYVDLRDSGVDPSEVIFDWGGTAIAEQGTWVRTGNGIGQPMSVLDAYNAVNDPQLSDDIGWTPELRDGPVLPAVGVPAYVGARAGAGKLADLLGDNPATPPGPPDPTEPPDESVWNSVDIDNPPNLATGTTATNENGDAVTISGNGKFESGNQVFRFVYTDVEGDFTFSARLDDVDFGGLTSNQARVGLLFGPDLTTTGTEFLYGGAMVVGDGTYRRTDRLAVGNSATTTVNVSGSGERYIRLTRTGNQHQAAFSLDGGQTYTTAAVRTFTDPLPDLLHVGFAVNSSSNDVSASATFSDVHIFDGDGNLIIGPDSFGDIGGTN